ncbi:MAG TPA: SDR family oxidoreductase [Actinomycetaceae bacterium]|nr:SDR family oxidoreductase [Actinomycetaceae bacterium]
MTRTYVITGAGSGIGAKTAELLRAAGHTVAGVDLKNAEVTADLSTPEGRRDGAAAATKAVGGTVDGVIACAGLSLDKAITAKVNYFGVTEFLEALLPALGKSEAPRAAVVSSMSSLQPNHPPLVDALLNGDEDAAVAIAEEIADSANLIYASTKRAVSRWVRRESIKENWAGAGIPLNAVGPGIVVTPMTAPLLADPETAAMVDRMVPMPLNGHQQPESVANLLIWLTSAENSHTTGQTIYVDGGADATLRGEDAWTWADAHVGEYFTSMAQQD